jgi:hypothetical protein
MSQVQTATLSLAVRAQAPRQPAARTISRQTVFADDTCVSTGPGFEFEGPVLRNHYPRQCCVANAEEAARDASNLKVTNVAEARIASSI